MVVTAAVRTLVAAGAEARTVTLAVPVERTVAAPVTTAVVTTLEGTATTVEPAVTVLAVRHSHEAPTA